MENEKILLRLKENNQTVISADGMDIKVVGDTITFTIGQTNWEMSVGQCEAMLESHQLLKDACHQFLNAMKTDDEGEIQNAIYSAGQALRRAD